MSDAAADFLLAIEGHVFYRLAALTSTVWADAGSLADALLVEDPSAKERFERLKTDAGTLGTEAAAIVNSLSAELSTVSTLVSETSADLSSNDFDILQAARVALRLGKVLVALNKVHQILATEAARRADGTGDESLKAQLMLGWAPLKRPFQAAAGEAGNLLDNLGKALGIDNAVQKLGEMVDVDESGGVIRVTSIVAVLFLRDEGANMARAIEQTVRGPSGDPRSRLAEPRPKPDPWPEELGADELVYRLQTPIPENWIPLVPVSARPGKLSLRKGAMIRSQSLDDGQRGPLDGTPIGPLGYTLAPTPLTFPSEELPREGVALRVVPCLARRADGCYVTWCGYRMGTGTGEASSRLAWDAAVTQPDSSPER